MTILASSQDASKPRSTTASWLRRGLYLLTPDCADTTRLITMLRLALRGPVAMVQYRSKHASADLRRAQAAEVARVCALAGVPFIINDDLELARSLGAQGVHLGADDVDVKTARQRLGSQAIVGASCYGDLERAAIASAEGASYLAFGAFYPSLTKPTAQSIPLDVLRHAAQFGLPRVAIGGIRADNARPIIAAGAELVAVISDVFDAADIEAAVRRYAPLFEDQSG